jgi:D-amino-acid dehydrogenase
MKVAILGAGIAGITTAYQLSRDGHEVTLVDRQPDASLECSYANGGFVAISQAAPWSSPGVLLRVMSTMLRPDAPILLHPSQLPVMWRWGLQFLSCSSAAVSWENTKHILRLALYSAELRKRVREEAQVAYFRRANGCLTVYASTESLEKFAKEQEAQIPLGIRFELLSADQCLRMVPALDASRQTLAGGIFVPDEEGGDCYEFCRVLTQRLSEAGAALRFSSSIKKIEFDKGRITGIVTSTGPVIADCYVLAAGADSPLIMRPLGVRIPVIPVKGYSMTVPRKPWPDAPDMQIVDDDNLFGLNPLGDDRLRLAGLAEIAGYDRAPRQRRTQAFVAGFLKRFPQLAACLAQAKQEPFCCLRPVTPSGLPILGRSRFTNLFYNVGHGHLGWTLAHGTARILADQIGGKPTEIDSAPYMPNPTF